MDGNEWRQRAPAGGSFIEIDLYKQRCGEGTAGGSGERPRRRDCFSDLLHPLADHPETLTLSYACCDAAPPASFPLDRMSMKEPPPPPHHPPLSLSFSPPPPTTCFHTLQAEEPPFHASAVHLKCPVAEHMHSRRSVVFRRNAVSHLPNEPSVS